MKAVVNIDLEAAELTDLLGRLKGIQVKILNAVADYDLQPDPDDILEKLRTFWQDRKRRRIKPEDAHEQEILELGYELGWLDAAMFADQQDTDPLGSQALDRLEAFLSTLG